MTIETIVEMLNTITADVGYALVESGIKVQVHDMGRMTNERAVDEVLWKLEESADEVEHDECGEYYRYGELMVDINYDSVDD